MSIVLERAGVDAIVGSDAKIDGSAANSVDLERAVAVVHAVAF